MMHTQVIMSLPEEWNEFGGVLTKVVNAEKAATGAEEMYIKISEMNMYSNTTRQNTGIHIQSRVH